MLISRQTAQTICRAGLAGEALRPLLDWAAAVVPRRARARTPVFLFGTAGLRRLSGAQQGELLRHARDTLSESPFRCNLEAQKHVKRCWRHTEHRNRTGMPGMVRNTKGHSLDRPRLSDCAQRFFSASRKGVGRMSRPTATSWPCSGNLMSETRPLLPPGSSRAGPRW